MRDRGVGRFRPRLFVPFCLRVLSDQFAPPQMSFAPPPHSSEKRNSLSPPPPPLAVPAVEVPDDATGEDAYARRLRLSRQAQGHSAYEPAAPSLQELPPPPPPSPPPPPPTVFNSPPSAYLPDAAPPPLPPPIAATALASTLARAPVRYSLPPAPSEIPKSEEELENALQAEEGDPEDDIESGEAPRSLRPGQKGFAERLMSKYGWTKGSGLGANNSGIINPLRVHVEKQKKKPDSEGGGFVGPGGRGKIIGGKKKWGDETGKFGAMSEVVILHGMVDGMDLQRELGEGNLMQEIGEECSEKASGAADLLELGFLLLTIEQYGRVERVYIDQTAETTVPVFIKFTSQLSALRVCYILLRSRRRGT